MPDNNSIINQLVSGIEFADPKLKDALLLLAEDLYALNNQINPPEFISRTIQIDPTVSVNGPNQFIIEVFPNNIRLRWTAPGAGVFLYEVRMGGTAQSLPEEFEAAEILLTTATLSADIDPIGRNIVAGHWYEFWVSTVDNEGNHSLPSAVGVDIPPIGAPVLSITTLDNNVLLSWTIPSSVFFLAYYTVCRNGVPIGNITGTFNVTFEPLAGTYAYTVKAFDIVGTSGPPSNEIIITLNNPPNYLQFGDFTSTFPGTKVNTKLISDGLFANVNLTETWNDHFSTRSWATIQDQIDDDYPFYFQPSLINGSYEEIFDFGTIFTDVIIVVTYGATIVTGVVSTQIQVALSTDGISYGGFVTGSSVPAASVRYVKLRLNFTAADDTAGTIINNLRIMINVRTEADEGTVNALAADAGGTHVTFAKSFKIVRSVSLVPQSITSCFAVYDDLATTGFDVYVFDAAGVRIDKTVAWAVRGMV